MESVNVGHGITFSLSDRLLDILVARSENLFPLSNYKFEALALLVRHKSRELQNDTLVRPSSMSYLSCILHEPCVCCVFIAATLRRVSNSPDDAPRGHHVWAIGPSPTPSLPSPRCLPARAIIFGCGSF